MGELSNTASDIVGGLRVLRGIGGEQVFHDRYAASRRPPAGPASRSRGCSRCSTRSRCSCPASSWWSSSGSARGTPCEGEITPGELVAFYGYSAFLMIPLRTATEYANKLIRARVAAARVCRVLALEPEVVEPGAPAPRRPPPGAELADARTGLRVRAGRADRDRERAARRVGGARRPARPARPHPSTTTSPSAAYR